MLYINKKKNMTRISALPACSYRYGRTDIVEGNDGKKRVRPIICCGYREVEPEECIICQGFPNTKFEFSIVSFMAVKKDLRFRKGKNHRNSQNLK